ncbi:FecR family protein [Chitinophaga skermanii]|uniref:FecR family protein n=1 Tax=Chitinophaga skermanii TaxID=331697 RepID=A0A327Q7L6_9BACT|nr:FecR family protein [Chitinophaga skermanii]RAJ00499.1 FecR family protein [Chitinophaga skermanii]
MNKETIAALLLKYQNGECSEEEKQLVEQFYQGFDAEEDTLPTQEAMQPHYHTLYTNIMAKVQTTHPTPKRLFTIQRLAMAAAILALCVVSVWLLMPTKRTPTLAQNQPAKEQGKRFIKLADGSSVLLKAGSQLQYPHTFNGATRDVYLTGEAYFNIAPHATQPFVVHTGDVTTTVLGTAFNVKAMEGEAQVTVTVQTGKVKVDASGKALGVLTSNEQLLVSQKDEKVERNTAVNMAPVMNWAQEDISFNNATYAEAASVLSEKYGVQIIFERKETQHCRFTTSFLNQSSLEDILTVLCAFNQSTYQIQNSIVTIYGGQCN